MSIITENSIITYKLPLKCSFYTAKVLAIYKAVQNTMKNNNRSHNNYLIISDSLSNLIGISNPTDPTDISKLNQEKTYKACQKGKVISFLSIPGHSGINGNELAD